MIINQKQRTKKKQCGFNCVLRRFVFCSSFSTFFRDSGHLVSGTSNPAVRWLETGDEFVWVKSSFYRYKTRRKLLLIRQISIKIDENPIENELKTRFEKKNVLKQRHANFSLSSIKKHQHALKRSSSSICLVS